jgi:spore germination cell wall hydrolase CwlJ-like protein
MRPSQRPRPVPGLLPVRRYARPAPEAIRTAAVALARRISQGKAAYIYRAAPDTIRQWRREAKRA